MLEHLTAPGWLACLFFWDCYAVELFVALRGRAALLDTISLSVSDFWKVHCRSAGAEQAFEFFGHGFSKL
jgi:hypothetical protein